MSDSSASNANPFDMDSSHFESDKFLQKVLKECSLKQIMDTEAAVIRDTQTLHSDMQTLVYENYNKFISATDTIRKMKLDFKQMETEMNSLSSNMKSITSFSEHISGTLQDSRSQLNKLSEKLSLLKRLQFLSSLPTKLKNLIDERNYGQAVQDYIHAKRALKHYENQPSFKGIQEDCAMIIEELRNKLKEDFHKVGNTAQALTETGELLLQLGEKPEELAAEMMQCSSQRLQEQIMILKDQTERDMIEFVDLGIEGFLNDLTLVVSSYRDMFLEKHHRPEMDEFTDIARKDLGDFIKNNMEMYLSLVQDRVDAETGRGDSQITLRALDRLHRRLLAMKGICQETDMTKTGIEIILNAAHQLCKVHRKNLKMHFFDSLSSIRLSLLSTKSDNNLTNVPNLHELINTLFTSTVEKVKGVLQDLLVFLQPEWSFNLKADCKETLCVEAIRENLLVGFLKHIANVMVSFGDVNTTTPPNLLLVLSKMCIEMERTGVTQLINLVDDLYEITSNTKMKITNNTELCTEMRDSAQTLLDSYVRLQGLNISQMLRKSVEQRDWLNCLEPRSVRAVMKRVVEELTSIEGVLNGLYESGTMTSASSDSSRKTHFSSLAASKQQFRSNWSNYTPSQLESNFASNIHKLFSEKIEIFSSVEFSKISILTGIIKISLKTFLECVRLKTFSKFGLQQIQVDSHYLQMNLWRFVSDENLIHFLLDEVLGSAVHRCLDPNLMEPNAVEIICERG